MKSILTTSCSIHFGDTAFQALYSYLQSSNHSKIFVLVDVNTKASCLPVLIDKMANNLQIEIIEIPNGEIHKTIISCLNVWRRLSELGADRNSLMVNLGGGVVTDLGGFVASTFKRGLKFINIPTSLLAMVDASVGGKTGVDLDLSKNQVGTITFAEMVLIDAKFLDTLPKEELRSGMAEMLKHGLISDRLYWDALKGLKSPKTADLTPSIFRSVEIKNAIVTQDPNEMNVRKFLNFGHTLGHAIESYCLDSKTLKTLLHGEAIAIGMVLEAFLSYKLCGLSENDLITIKTTFSEIYEKCEFGDENIKSILNLLKHDKKNTHGRVNFVLLEAIGKCRLDVEVSEALIYDAFRYYAKG